MSSASGGFAPDTHRGAAPGPCWGTSVLQTPSLPIPGKNPAGVHATYFLTLVSYWLHSCFCFFVAFSPYLYVCIFLFFATTSWQINIYTRIYSASNNSLGVDSILCSLLTLCVRYTWFRTRTKCQPEYTSLSKSVRTSDMTASFSSVLLLVEQRLYSACCKFTVCFVHTTFPPKRGNFAVREVPGCRSSC